MAEVRQAISNGTLGDPGPASLELAVRAAYPLIVSGRLFADRGTAGNDQPDRRRPGEVLEAMRQTPQGIHQMVQALRDFGAGVNIRAVDQDGAVIPLDSGDGERTVNDVYLRGEFPPPGKARARRSGESVMDRYANAVSRFAEAVAIVGKAFEALKAVQGDDDRPVVEAFGIDHRSCDEWRKLIGTVDDELAYWSKIHQRSHGNGARHRIDRDDEDGVEGGDPAREWDDADVAEAA